MPKKQDLWEAVVARIGEKFQRRWLAAERGATDPLARLRGIVVAQLTPIRSMPAIPAILFSRELHVENRALRVIFAELMREFQRRIERLIDAGQREGLLRRDIDAEDAAFLVIGLVHGLVRRWFLAGRSFDLPGEGGRLLDVQLAMLGAGSSAEKTGAALRPRRSRKGSEARTAS